MEQLCNIDFINTITNGKLVVNPELQQGQVNYVVLFNLGSLDGIYRNKSNETEITFDDLVFVKKLSDLNNNLPLGNYVLERIGELNGK